MARPLSDILIDFVAKLREEGVGISVAESLDAVQAVSVAGVAPVRMREALRASLIKDEADSPIFDRVFAEFFAAPSRSGHQRESRGARLGLSGSRGDGAGMTPPPPGLKAVAAALPRSGLDEPDVERVSSSLEANVRRISSTTERKASSAQAAGREADRSGDKGGPAPEAHAGSGRDGAEAIAPEQAPFADYSPLEYEQ